MSRTGWTRYHRALGQLVRWGNAKKDFMKDRSNPQIYIDRMKYFLGLLGNPQNSYAVIHVAGTAGKGTVSTMLQQCLVAAGYRAGLYTSPYCVSVIENIRMNQLYILPESFASIVNSMRRAVQASVHSPFGQPSYFELLTAVALLYFQQSRSKWVVLEAGLGGRYDATNAVERPAVTAITSIGYDHTDILGNTLSRIVRDKAGIIKSGSHFFTTVHQPDLLGILRKTCTVQSAVFHQIRGSNEELTRAIGTFLKLPTSAVEIGIRRTWLPARLERVERDPAIILDGAHNELKINYLFDRLKNIPVQNRIVIFGLADDKDKKRILKRVARETDRIIFTPFAITGFPGRHCADPGELARRIRQFNPRVDWSIARSPLAALRKARAIAARSSTIIVTGSFYLCGEVRKQWYPEEWVLGHRRSF